MHRSKFQSGMLIGCAVAWLGGCGGGGSGNTAANPTQGPVQPTTAVVDRSCDAAAYPSLEWTQCEAQNFAKTGEAPAEQVAPAFVARLAEQSTANTAEWTQRAADDPSWLLLPSGNTPLLPLCTTYGLQCAGDPFRYASATGADGAPFYADTAEVTPVLFYDRECARLSGRVWKPRGASGALPNIVIVNGSVQAPETVYWFAAQALVRAGYAVMTFDPRGQGRSDQQTPSGEQGSNANATVFWEGLVDAIDFFRSHPTTPYPHNASCAASYPTPMTAFNPIHAALDPQRLGIAGHSLGAIGVSIVQGYDAPGAATWPGVMDATNPVQVAVGWDSLTTPDGEGFAPSENLPLPPELAAALQTIGTQGARPAFGPRVPALSFHADYGLVPTPYLMPPDPEGHKLPFDAWVAAGLPTMSLTFAGTTHFDYSLIPTFPSTSWCPDTSSGACVGGWGNPAIRHYTLAWFDRFLKQPGEAGYASADSRLLDDGGAQGMTKLSFRFRSARAFTDRGGFAQRCEDIRAGC